MPKTTATVTVGADTNPFQRAMKGLGGKIGGVGGRISADLGKSIVTGLSGGLAFGLTSVGLGSIESLFNMMRVTSPKFESAIQQLSSTVMQALVPVATMLAEKLIQWMPEIQNAVMAMGNFMADVIQFWTEDVLDPRVWKDIGMAIGEGLWSISADFKEQTPDIVRSQVAGSTGSDTVGDIAGFIAEAVIFTYFGGWRDTLASTAGAISI
jgi:hypothetical protein